MNRSGLTAAFLLLACTGSSLVAQERPKYLDAADILKIVRDSKNSYGIKEGTAGEGELADPLSIMFPESVKPVEGPIVSVDARGRKKLDSYRITEQMAGYLERAEPLFEAGKYDEAREIYRELVAAVPDCFFAVSHIGDTYFRTGGYDSALVWYERAIAMNRNDYHLAFYRARTLHALGRFQESRREYIRTLMLNPRHKGTYKDLEAYANDLGITLNSTLFTPKALAVATGEGVDVTVDMKGGAHWMVYGLAKGMWLGEPDHREALTGKRERSIWSSTEDVESILALLNVYIQTVEEGETAKSEQLERLLKVIKDGYVSAFVIYEFGSRSIPDIVLTQSDEFQASITGFIGTYVVPLK